VGGDGDDLLEGGNGDDYLDGGNGVDVLNGGAGDDTFKVGDSRNHDQVDGGDGTDTLVADLSWFSGDFALDNDPAVTTVLPGGTIYTGIEGFNLTLGAGNDALDNTRTGGSDYWITGDGNDVINSGGGNDVIDAGDGNDTIDSGSGNDVVNAGAGDDVIYHKDGGYDTVDGGAGVDRLVLDFSGDTRKLREYAYDATGDLLGAINWDGVVPDGTVKIRIGGDINSYYYYLSNVFGVTYSGIEHLEVTGTPYDDWLVGGALADVLRGGGGSDYLVGGDGDDLLEGGNGDDYLDGGNGVDVLNGGAGDDTFLVRDGDRLDGDDGSDTVSCAGAPAAVLVDMSLGLVINNGYGFQNILASVENVIGSNYNDVFRGGPGNNAFDGGAGFDTVDYSAATGGVVVDLRPGTAFQDGMGGQDTLSRIELIIGSSYNDVLIGNGGDNFFDPGTGSDALDGGAGTDRLVIEWSTVAVAGPGDGILMDAYDAGGTPIDDPALAVEWFIRQQVGTANQVSARNFETFSLTGTAADDVLRGTVLADTLSGSAGDDVLDGNLGADLLAGGDGADTFIGTLAHLDGDSIADLAPDDVIVVSGARFTGDGVVFSDGKLVIDPSGDGTTNVSIALDGSFTGRFEATPSDPNDAASTSIRYIAELPVISIKALDAEKPEGEFGVTPFTFEVTRSGDLGGTSSVDYAVSGWGDNPTDWRDFDGPTIGTVFFAPGEALKSITVDVAKDAHSEFSEDFTVALSTPVAATVASHGAVGTITNRTLLVDAGISGEDLHTVYQLTKSAYGLAALPGGWERLVALPAFADKAFDPIRNLDPTTRDKGFDSDGFFIGKSQYSDLGGSGDPPKILVAAHLTLGKIDSIALAAPGGYVYPTYVHGHLYDSVAMLLDAINSFVESSIDRPDVWVTGHSRGGGQTNEIFEFSNGDGTVFDSARYVGFSSFEVSRSATEKNILHIGYENDPVFREWISDTSYAKSTRVGTASSTDHFVYFDHGHIWNYWWGPYTRASHNFSALDRIVDAVTLSDASGYIGIDTVVLVDSYSGTVVDNPGSRNDHLGSSAVILGDYLNDHLVGRDRSDVIFGFSGSDTIDGGGGNDTVDGGVGADVLIGGNGKDIFVGSQATLNGDTISDFSPQDIIRFDGVLFGSGQLDYTAGLLLVDSDTSGTFETAIKLDGDFSAGKFVATHSAPSEPLHTLITYEASDVLVWIVPSAISKYEGDAGSVTEYVYTVIRWGDLEKTSVVQCTIAPDGTDGADPDDFEGGVFPLSRELTFQKDQTSQDIRIRVQGDNQKNENDEGFKITLSAIKNATIVPDKREAVGIIQDDDTLPRLSVSDATARESDGEIVFKVIRTGDLDYDSAANWRVELPSPAAYGQASDTDLGKVLQGTVFFHRGSTDPQTIKVAIVDDPDFEPSETFPVILDKPLNAVLTKDTARGTIKDDDGDGEVSITAIDADKDEGTATSAPVTPTEFTFEVSRSGKSQDAFSVKYAVSGSGTHPHTATVPDDFIGLTTDTLHFAENEPSKIVTIHVAPDDQDEEDEGFLVTLSDPTNDFQIGQPDAAFGLIRNDDDLVFSIAPQNASQLEGDKKTTDFTFTVTRGGNVHAGDIECSVDWAVTVGSSGGPWADRTADFDGRIIGTVDFAADGVLTKTIHVPVKGETIPEANEIFDVKLSHPQRQAGGVSASPTIGTDTARGTIMDDDSRKLSIVSAVSKQEGTDTKDPIILTEFNFTVTRSNTEGSLEVPYGVTPGPSRPADGSDVPGLSYHDRLIFGDGIGSAVITVKVQPDNTIESDETFFVALGETEGWTFNNRLAVGTIQDDDAQRVSISGVGRSEGSNGGTTPFKFMVTRSNTKGELDLSYTVTPGPISPVDGSDIAGLGSFPTLHFADGEGKQTIQVNVNRDNDKEPNETFYVTLSDPGTGLTFGNRQAVGTISNDDPVPPWPRPVLRGDPHLVTLDGLACDFQAVGEFVAMQSADGTDVAVQIRTTAVGDLASNITAVAVLIDGHRVTITAGAEATLRVGGVATTVPDDVGVLPIGSGFVEYDGSTYTLTDPGGAGMIVQPVAGRLDLVLTVDPAYAGALYGLLGNFNGDPTDDLALADGTVLTQPVSFADLYGAYADSWRVTEATSLFDYDAGESTATLTDRAFPRQIVTLDMLPEEVVTRATALVDEAGISEPALRAAAILDLALTGDTSYLLGATIPVPVTSVVEIIDAPSPLPILTVVGPDSVHWEGDTGNTSVHFEVYRSSSVAGELTVNYQVLPSGDHPANADDFGGTLPSGFLKFDDGEALKAIEVIIAADTLAEYSEVFAVRLSVDAADRDSVLFSAPSATATIENDDGDLPVRLDIIALTGIAAEGDAGLTTLAFEVIRSGNGTTETLVDYSVLGIGPDAAESNDFGGGVYPRGSLSFLAGETRKSIAIEVRGDRTTEPDKHFVVKLADATNASIGSETATGIILNDDVPPPPNLAISGFDAVKTEGNSDTTAFTFVVSRTGDTSAQTAVDYFVTGLGVEVADATDFGGAFPTGSVIFAASETEKLITIAVSGDTGVEPDEAFTVTLGNVVNGTITTASADGIILNDDLPPPPELAIVTRDAVKAEGDSGTTMLTFAVTRTGDLGRTSTVGYTVAGAGPNPVDADDFGGILPTGRISFAAGEDEKLLSIAVSVDTTVEDDEGFVVTLGDATNGTVTTASATGTIENDDSLPPPELAITARDAVKTEGDGGNTVFTFAVSRIGDTGAETTVDYLVAGFGVDPASGTDFGGAFPAGSVLFAAGEDEKLISVEVSGDNAIEPDEGFSVTLTNPANATLAVASAVGTIENDDTLPPPILSIAPVHAQRAEGDTGFTAFTFVISRSGDLSTETRVQYGVSGAATADDFAGGVLPVGTIVFAAGSAEQLLSIDVTGDTRIESHEAFAVTLHDPVNGTIATGSAAGVIFNDDSAAFSIGDAPARPPRSDAGAWERSWSHDGVSISHKANLDDEAEPFTDVLFGSSGSGVLAGGDVSAGDLGVSGQTLPSSSVLQEIDGTEALRFVLDEEANQITFQLSRFLRDDDGTGLNEAGRLQLLDADDDLVEELFFYADQADGTKQISLSLADGFKQAILSAGAQRGEDFVYGGYGNADSSGFGASPFATNGSLHGSDYLVDSVQFVSGSVDMLLV
jgi:Ca2+-binding RTX toxin-like protein